jgi:hypothetical protein
MQLAYSEMLCALFKDKVDYITFGLDISQNPENKNKAPHVELVGNFNVNDCLWGWYGKHYPLAAQERTLLRPGPLHQHFVGLSGVYTYIFGCHDLNMFNNRAFMNTIPGSFRNTMCKRFQKQASDNDIRIILHHPHGTDSDNIWRNSWAWLRNNTSVEHYASAINYYNYWGGECRQPLEKVLEHTRFGDVEDLIIETTK